MIIVIKDLRVVEQADPVKMIFTGTCSQMRAQESNKLPVIRNSRRMTLLGIIIMVDDI